MVYNGHENWWAECYVVPDRRVGLKKIEGVLARLQRDLPGRRWKALLNRELKKSSWMLVKLVLGEARVVSGNSICFLTVTRPIYKPRAHLPKVIL